MSKKWTTIGTNALEAQNPENMIKDSKEKSIFHWKRKRKLLKDKIKIEKMEIEKPKKNKIDENFIENENDTIK